jgi:pyrophosphatase PpaX
VTYQTLLRETASTLAPFPLVPDVIEQLAAGGIKLGVVTSRNKADAARSLRDGEVARFFQVVVTYGDARPPKPHPAPILHGLALLGLPPDEAAYVGDTTDDVHAAKRAGVVAIAATWAETCDVDALRATSPDLIVAEPSDLLSLVPTLTGH